MNTTKTFLSVLALAAFSGAAIAQDTTTSTTTDTAAPAEDQAATAPVDPTLDTGTADGDQLGAGYVREESGDWQVQCVRMEDPANEPCQLYQLLRGPEGNPVAEFIIEKLPEGGQVAAGATILVPHGTALAKDLRIAVDGSQGKVYRYAFCDQRACYARIGLLPGDIASFKKGAKATMTITPFERLDTEVGLDVSLSGFTAGYDGLAPKQAAN